MTFSPFPTNLRRLCHFGAAIGLALSGLSALRAATPPQIGETAPNFTLQSLGNESVELRPLHAKNPVVLLVLRGWPGYQCPLCTKQVHEFVARAAAFAERGVSVLLVYPGPAEALQAHAREFSAKEQWPANFHFVIDPDYTFTHAYGLRWEAKNETAYPSTFVIGRDGKVTFAHVSKTHGNRTTAAQVLAALQEP